MTKASPTHQRRGSALPTPARARATAADWTRAAAWLVGTLAVLGVATWQFFEPRGFAQVGPDAVDADISIQRGASPGRAIPRADRGLPFVVPAGGQVTSCFGPRRGRHHDGIDFGAPKGTPIISASGGEVAYVGRYGAYGRTVVVSSPPYRIVYGHLQRYKVQVGQKLRRGQTVLGTMGNSGRSTGYHLHFEVRKDGQPINPASLIAGLSSRPGKRCGRYPKMRRITKRELPRSFLPRPKLAIIPALGSPNSATGLYGLSMEYFLDSGWLFGAGLGAYNSTPFVDKTEGTIDQNTYSIKVGHAFDWGRIRPTLNMTLSRMVVSSVTGPTASKRAKTANKKARIPTKTAEYYGFNPQIGFYWLLRRGFIFNMEYGRYLSLSDSYLTDYNARVLPADGKKPSQKAPLDTFHLGLGISL